MKIRTYGYINIIPELDFHDLHDFVLKASHGVRVVLYLPDQLEDAAKLVLDHKKIEYDYGILILWDGPADTKQIDIINEL